MKYTGNTPFGLRQTDHNSSGIFSAGVERITIDSNGEVGIGTTSPTQALHVEGSIFIKNNSFIRSKDGGSTVYDLLGVLSNGHVQVGQPNRGLKFRGGGSTSDIYFELAGSTQFILKGNTGNLGIGTTNPTYKLDVAGDTRIGSTNPIGSENAKLKVLAAYEGGTMNGALIEANGNTSTLILRHTGNASKGLYVDGTQAQALGDGIYIESADTVTRYLRFRNNTTDVFKVETDGETHIAGKVGIGTTSPTQALHVDGKLRLDGSVYNGNLTYLEFDPNASDSFISQKGGGNYLILRGTNGVKLQRNSGTTVQVVLGEDAQKIVANGSADTMSFLTANSEKLRILANGNIGIGTTSPTDRLHVVGDLRVQTTTPANTAGTARIELNPEAGTPAYIEAVANFNPTSATAYSSGFKFIVQNRDASLQNPYYTIDAMAINANGNVGIGTNNPNEKLQVVGDIASQGIYVDRTHEGGGVAEPFAKFGLHHIYGDANAFILAKTGNSANASFSFQTQTGLFTASTVQLDGPNGYIRRVSGTLDLGVIQHNAANNNFGKYISITNNPNATGTRGRVDINGDLRVIDYSTSSPIEKTKISNNGSAYFSGDVGIGTTSPTRNLSVVGDSSATGLGNHQVAIGIDNINTTNGNWASLIFDSNSGAVADISARYVDHANNYGDLALNTRSALGWTSKIYIKSEGNVGIGTNSPTHKLQVAGTFKSVGINDSSSAQAIFINGNGEVGIGATNQTTALDVGGVFQFSTTTDLLQINNNTNTGGINLSGNNSRIYFGGHRAIEGNQAGTNLVLGEGYSNVQIHSNATLVANGNQTIGGNLTVSGRTDLQRDLRLRGTDASPNLGVVRMYVDGNDTLFIDAANDGNNRVEINSSGDLTVPGIITAQEFRTEYISQTIIFESGSTTFGDDADDVHTRNGSIIINKNHSGVLTGNRVDALIINNDSMGSTGPETRIKFQANSNPTATISTKVDGSGVGGGLSFEVAENPTTLTTRLKIDKSGSIGISAEPVANSLLKLGLRNTNGDGILLENTTNSNEVAKLYQDNGTEGILSLSNSGLEHVKIRSNGASFFDGGTVGFGTQNPSSSYKVDIVGKLKVGGGPSEGDFLEVFGGVEQGKLTLRQFHSSPQGTLKFNFDTGPESLFQFTLGESTEIVRFDHQRNYFAKKVGIGTSSATTPLDIVDELPAIRLEDPVAGASSLLSGDGGNITLSADQGNQDGGSHIAFRVDNSEKARITSAGNLGVGTSSPSYPLDVNGAMRASSYRIGGGTVLSGLSTVYLGSGGATGAIGLVTTSGQGLTLNGANVGIGTTSPSDKLTVQDGTITSRDATGINYAKIDRFSGVTLAGNGTGSRGVQTPNADALTFGTNATERMRIDSSGRVFIGTTTYGANNNGNDLIVGNTSGTHGLTIVSQNNSVGILYFGDNDNNDAGNINYEHSNNQLRFVTNRTQKMVIDSSGNVGIGTTSPTAKLHIGGDIKATSAALLGGNLQILKDLNASSLYKAGLGTTGAYGTPTLLTGYDGSTILQQRDGKQFTDIFAFGNRVISITTIGGRPKVGIGVTDPTEALEVAGSIEMHSQMSGQTISVLQKAGYNAGDPAGALMFSLNVNDNILGAFVDYTIYDNGRDNLRSGTLQIVFNGVGEVRFTDNSTSDIGDTTVAYFQAVGQAPGAEIKFVAPDSTWHVRYHVRYL